MLGELPAGYDGNTACLEDIKRAIAESRRQKDKGRCSKEWEDGIRYLSGNFHSGQSRSGGLEEIESLAVSLEVENTCVKAHTANDGEIHTLPRSTKPDAGNYGFGIANVRDTAAKYGGLLYIEQNGNRFIAILTIAKSCLAKYNATVETSNTP